MTGNDVIDLGDDDSRAACRHPRVDERVLAESERALLATSGAADRVRRDNAVVLGPSAILADRA